MKRSITIFFHSGIVTLTSPSKFLTGTIFLHVHLQAVYYNCAKFHLIPMSRLGGVALTSPSLHTERISEYQLNYPPSKFLTATILLHAHLQVVYYKCVKCHKNPISRLGGVALARYMDGRTDGRTDRRTDGRTNRVIPIYPPNFVCGGYNDYPNVLYLSIFFLYEN